MIENKGGISRRNLMFRASAASAGLLMARSAAAQLAPTPSIGHAIDFRGVTVRGVTFMNNDITLSANVYFPENFDASRTHPTIVVVHPGGGVKEQTAGLYALTLAGEGFVTMAFDASHQGASGGMPRFVDDPMKRVVDVYSAVDYLTSLPYVDAERIGALGVCAGSGIAVKASMTERRIKAIATVSAVDVGAATRKGWDGQSAEADLVTTLDAVAKQRTAEAAGGAPVYVNYVPKLGDTTAPRDLQEAADYYLTARGSYPTSPQYSIIASCDVAAAMMEPPGGTALVEESILEALDFRRAMRKVDEEFGENDWWFQVWGPDALEEEGIGRTKDWVLRRTDSEGVQRDGEESWHGFGDMAPGFNMLDPIKATIITPGLDIDGRFDTTGIPASIVSKYLAEHGVVVEKTGLYSFFILFTIGITKGRWNTLVAALQQFKDDYDRNQPLWRVMPEFSAKHPRYERMGLRDLSQHVHALYAKYDVARLSTEIYLSDHHPAMTPSEAFSHIARRKTQRVAVDELQGRITTSLVTPYSPGIPLLIPGETFNAKIVDYLRFNREFARECPGFETDIHGLVIETHSDGVVSHYADCVAL